MTAGGNRGFDARVAHPARVYDYWLSGKDNFEAPTSLWGGVGRKP